jgi:hypothetical protein
LIGLLTFGMGGLIGVYLSLMKLIYGIALAERPLLLLAILMVMIGVQLVTMGLIGEMVVRTYHESQGKTIYAIREELG